MKMVLQADNLFIKEFDILEYRNFNNSDTLRGWFFLIHTIFRKKRVKIFVRGFRGATPEYLGFNSPQCY